MRRLIAPLLLALPALLLSISPSVAEEGVYRAGVDFDIIGQPVPAGSDGKVEVVEMFWYGCPHCYEFEPLLEDWLENKPENVEFVRIPAIFNNPRWKLHAQAYYTAEVLGILEKFHKPFFNALHRDRLRMNDKASVAQFFERMDVDAKTFEETFESFAVQTKVRRAADLTRRYGITGVPAMIVNGKYRSDGTKARSYERLLDIVESLVKQEAS